LSLFLNFLRVNPRPKKFSIASIFFAEDDFSVPRDVAAGAYLLAPVRPERVVIVRVCFPV